MDTNRNGQLDAGELITVTDAQGEYAFTDLSAGRYVVAEIQQPGWEQTFPGEAEEPPPSEFQIDVNFIGGLTDSQRTIFTEAATLLTCRANPDESWRKQVARNLSDPFDGFLRKTRYLLMDRDAKYCKAFRDILEGAGVNSVRLPPRSPHLNLHLERYFGSLKSECLSKMIFFGARSAILASRCIKRASRRAATTTQQTVEGI